MAAPNAQPTAGDPRRMYPNPPFKNIKHQEWPGLDSKIDPKPDWGETSYKGSERMKGMVALITGGDSGIGRAVAVAFSREGCDVAISYLPQEQSDAEDCKRMVEIAGRKCVLLPGDLCDKKYCSDIVEQTVAQLGKLDVLVNNAAYQGEAMEGIHELSYERVMRAFQTNIVAMFETSKAALKHLPPGGSICNTGSIQAYFGNPAILDYACTKAAIVDFTKGLSNQVIKQGIRVNCVAPGPVLTPLVCASFPEDKLKEFGGRYPIERPAMPAELAPAYVYLATASYVNGEILGVTGGGILA